GMDPRDDVAEQPALVVLVPPRPLLERQPVVVPAPRVPRVDAVDLHAARLDQPGHRVDHAVVLPLPAVPLLRREDEQRPAPPAVREDPVAVLAPHRAARSRSSARCGWSVSRHAIQLWASRCSTMWTSQPCFSSEAATTWLLWMFSSAVPHVIVTGMRSAPERPPTTVETKRAIRSKRTNPDSCASSRRRK